ncbi:hypothetical protein BaRGS_00025097 [Batillaria attramentaria]|uniref:C2H2-type domain-containing protein n=1 Tax=Batillaria attramentaria TaxID=370345 RepID=A0ABD0K9A0_9CAEN
MEDKEDGGLALGADINHELLASILVEEPLTAPPPPSSLFEELTSSLMDSANMDLYLECDDDKSYAVPLQQQDLSLHSLLGSNVNMRISFPTPPSDVGSDEGSLSCKYCKCNFLSQNHLAMHTRTAHGETNHLNGRVKKSSSLERDSIDDGESNGSTSPVQAPGSAAALVPSIFSSGVAKSPKTLKLKRKSVKDKLKNGKHAPFIKKSKSDSEIKPQERQSLQQHPSEGGKVKSEVQYESTNETIDVEHTSPVSSPSSLPMNLDMTLKKHIAGVPFTCHICMKTYVSKYALKRHIATHSDERPFICSFPDCKGAFKLKSRLTDHIRYVHKRKTARTASRSKSLPSTTSQSAQDNVQSMVNSVPPPQGSNGFDSNGSGSKGLLGGKPSAYTKTFKCTMPHCSREFRDAYNLRVHMCLHTGHQPLKCSKCDFRCVQKTSLEFHFKKMHATS